MVDTTDAAEIVLNFRSESSLNPDCACTGGRGEVIVVRGDRRRVVLVYTGVKKGYLGKHPAENFARSFVDAVRGANGLSRLQR